MRESLSIRVDAANPNHHLWLNGGTWWIHYTVHTDDGRKRRVRFSLETEELQQARMLRDAIFAAWSPPYEPVERLLRSLLNAPPAARTPDDDDPPPYRAAPLLTLRNLGRRRKRIEVSDSYDGLAIQAQAPNSADTPRLARIDRGSNMRGSLFESFFLATDRREHSTHLVLWLGTDASQEDDYQSRLFPAARIPLCDLDDESEEEHPWREGGALLLDAWIRTATRSWGHYDCLDDAIIEGGALLDAETIERIYEAARNGLEFGVIDSEEDDQ